MKLFIYIQDCAYNDEDEYSGNCDQTESAYPADIYVFQVNNRNTKAGKKYVQS